MARERASDRRPPGFSLLKKPEPKPKPPTEYQLVFDPCIGSFVGFKHHPITEENKKEE